MELICSLVCGGKKGKKVTDFIFYYISSRIHGRIIKKEAGNCWTTKGQDHAERE